MYDLLITYEKKGTRYKRGYQTIMDFIDEMEYGRPPMAGLSAPDIPSPDDHVVHWTMFDNPSNAGSNTTIKALLEHCKEIVK